MALEQFIPLSCEWVGYLFMDSLPPPNPNPNCCYGEIITSLHEKRDDFPFKIVNFPDLSGNIPQDGSYGVFIAQTLRYAKACAKYTDFITRTLMLKTQLIKQNFHAKVLDRKLHRWHKRSDKAAVMVSLVMI